VKSTRVSGDILARVSVRMGGNPPLHQRMEGKVTNDLSAICNQDEKGQSKCAKSERRREGRCTERHRMEAEDKRKRGRGREAERQSSATAAHREMKRPIRTCLMRQNIYGRASLFAQFHKRLSAHSLSRLVVCPARSPAGREHFEVS
jgi:hypothetical protein